MSTFSSKPLHCPAGEWTRIIRHFGGGTWQQQFVVDLSPVEGKEVTGDYEVRPFWWVFPRQPRYGPLATRMRFVRDYMNAIYVVRVKPDMDCLATPRVVRGYVLRGTMAMLLLFGVLFGAGFLATYSSTKDFGRSAGCAEGVVVKNTRNGDVYYPSIRFANSQGKEHTFSSHLGSYPASYNIGQSVTVLFDPKAPNDARIDTFMDTWTTPFILGLFGGLAWIGGLVCLTLDMLFRKCTVPRSIAAEYPAPV